MAQNNNSWKKKYFILLAGQGISIISSGILQLAIIYYLVAKTNSAIVLTAATLIGFLPQACLGPFAGAFVDRHSRKSVMIGADLIIAAAGGILALMALFMELPVWAIMAILFIRSTGTAFHTPAFSATTPLIVPTEELTKCAGYAQTIQAVSSIISPAAAAFLYSVWPINMIILLDIAGAVLACTTVAISEIPTPKLCTEQKNQQFMKDLKEGYTILRKDPGLSALLFGGIILSIWGGFKKRRHTICFSILLMGVSITISGCLPPDAFIIFAVCCLCMGFAASFYGVQNAIFQEKVKPEYLGRVFSLLTSAASLAMPLGLVISGPLAEKFGVEKWFIICGIGIIIVAFSAFFLPNSMEINDTNVDAE